MQNVGRRTFLKLSASGAAVAVLPATALLEGCSTEWVDVVLKDLPTVVNIAGTILSIVATATGTGALSPVIGQIISASATALQASLQAFKDAVDAYNASKTQGNLNAVIAALQVAQNDARKVIEALPAGTVSTTVQLAIVGALGLVVTLLSSIQTLIPGGAPLSITTKAGIDVVRTKPVMPNADALKFGMNAVLNLHGFASAQIK